MRKSVEKIYSVTMCFLALISTALVILDYFNKITITSYPYNYIDNGILIIFTIDYVVRLMKSENKLTFITHNVFDLLSIIPFNSFFSFFRITRLSRLTRLTRLAKIFRIVGLTGRVSNELKKFLKTNGFIYLLLTCLSILLASSFTYSIAENISFGKALWWAIVTTTTVGYGDVSPRTLIGKTIATILMLVGIGFVGMLTSSITSYFAEKKETDSLNVILNKLEKLEKENLELNKKIEKMNSNK